MLPSKDDTHSFCKEQDCISGWRPTALALLQTILPSLSQAGSGKPP